MTSSLEVAATEVVPEVVGAEGAGVPGLALAGPREGLLGAGEEFPEAVPGEKEEREEAPLEVLPLATSLFVEEPEFRGLAAGPGGVVCSALLADFVVCTEAARLFPSIVICSTMRSSAETLLRDTANRFLADLFVEDESESALADFSEPVDESDLRSEAKDVSAAALVLMAPIRLFAVFIIPLLSEAERTSAC